MLTPSYLPPGRRAAGATILSAVMLSLLACSDAPTGTSSPRTEDQPPASAAALIAFQSPPWVGCQTGTQPGGALYRLCFPSTWNGDVVFWAHGYVAPQQPLAVPDDKIGGTPVEQAMTQLGYGFATTSYRRNGLAADVAVQDLEELEQIVTTAATPRRRLLAGVSEGALSAALALERTAPRFDGGLATCGPVGSFARQISHFGDFRAVFDYFFPGVLPGDGTTVPQSVRDNWFSVYVPLIGSQLATHPGETAQLLRVLRAPTDPADPSTVAQTVIGNLSFNVFGVDDAFARLGGNPYDNRSRWYTGSANDVLLNQGIKRYTASPAALAAVGAFETTGRLRRPTQSLHTTGDPIVPIFHQPLYQLKTFRAGAGLRLISFPVFRYGHCAFTMNEALASFAFLVLRVSGRNLVASADAFPTTDAQREFLALARKEGAAPVMVDGYAWREEARRQLQSR